MADSSLLGTAVNVFTAPRDAFEAIRAKPRAIFPLLLILAGLTAVAVTYLNLVDLGWFLESQLRASGAAERMSDEQIRQAAGNAARSRAFISAFSSVTSSLAVTLIFVVMALYLWAVSAIGRHGIRFGPAFALVCWCSLPGLLGFIATIANLFANDATFMPQYLTNPLSFASLLGLQPAAGSGGRQILLALDLTIVWSAVLLVLGYRAWSGRSLPVAAAIVLAPYGLLIGLAMTGPTG